MFNSKGVDTSADEGAPDDDFVFCPPTPAVVVVVVVAVRPESFRRAAEDDINYFRSFCFEEFSNFSDDFFPFFLWENCLRGKERISGFILYFLYPLYTR